MMPSLLLATPIVEKNINFSDLWVRQRDVDAGIRTIPTGTDLIYTFRAGTTQSKTIKMKFYWSGTCSTTSTEDGSIDATSSFTAGDTWYLSGSVLTSYVANAFFVTGSQGGGRISDYFNVKDTTANSQGTCTHLNNTNDDTGVTPNPYVSQDTTGSLLE